MSIFDDIKFWVHQTMEHAEYLATLLIDKRLVQISREFEANFKNNSLARLPDWKSFIQMLMNQQKQGYFIGYALPSLLQHFLDEHNILILAIQAQDSVASSHNNRDSNAIQKYNNFIVRYAGQHHAEEVQVLSKLTDPLLNVQTSIDKFITEFNNNQELEQFLYLSQELRKFQKDVFNTHLTILHPRLLHHIDREIEWFSSKLNPLLS